MDLHLIYYGANGQIFDGLRLGHSAEPLDLNVILRPADGHVLIPVSSLRSRSDIPPPVVWCEGLKILWPSLKTDKTGNIFVPLDEFAGIFCDDSTSGTEEALGPILVALLKYCRRTKKGSAWRRILRIEENAGDSETLRERLSKKTKVRDAETDARRRMKEKLTLHQAHQIQLRTRPRPRPKYTFSWTFLNCLVLSNWDVLKDQKRRERFLEKMSSLAGKISSHQSDLLDGVDINNNQNRFYQYLTDSRFNHFTRGARTVAEKEKDGIETVNRAKRRK